MQRAPEAAAVEAALAPANVAEWTMRQLLNHIFRAARALPRGRFQTSTLARRATSTVTPMVGGNTDPTAGAVSTTAASPMRSSRCSKARRERKTLSTIRGFGATWADQRSPPPARRHGQSSGRTSYPGRCTAGLATKSRWARCSKSSDKTRTSASGPGAFSPTEDAWAVLDTLLAQRGRHAARGSKVKGACHGCASQQRQHR